MAVLREEAFVDSSKIESVSGLTYGVNRPVKSASNPVYTGTSGEFDHHVVYVSAIPDPDGSGVWLYPGTHTENWGRGRLALAQSADGVTFTKPNLGIHSVDGDTNNNCVIDSTFKAFPFVTYVPSLTATPYVAVGVEIPVDGSSERYVKVWVSEDGIDFGSPVNSITITGMVRDSMSIVRRTDDKWMIYAQTRTGGDVRSVGVWRSDTTDITTTTWTFVNEFMLTGTSSAYQYYSFGAWIDGEVMYAAMCIYDSSGYYQNETYPSPPTPVPFITTTTADRQFKFELWTSRGDDGLTWTRIDADWMWSGANAGALDTTPGEWDYGCLVIGGQMVRVGDDWRYYYGGAAEQHHPSPAGPYGTLPWTQREAGFASTGYRRIGKLSGTGSVILDPITAAGSGATVTVNSTGTVTVELLDATTGAVLTGYASADCDAIPSDTVDHTVTWGGASVTPDEFKVKVYVTSGAVHFVEVADVTTVAVGASLAVPYSVIGEVGRSLAVTYGVGGAVGRSLNLTYVVNAPVGRSLEIPYGVETTGYRTMRLLIPAPASYSTRRTLLDTLTPAGPFIAKGTSRRHASAAGSSRRHAKLSGGPTP